MYPLANPKISRPFDRVQHKLILGEPRKILDKISDESIHLVITSPGKHENYPELKVVLSKCSRILVDGGKLCCLVQDEQTYSKIPVHARIMQLCFDIGFQVKCPIIWYHPHERTVEFPNGKIPNDIHYILIFKKKGQRKKLHINALKYSFVNESDYKTFFSQIWKNIKYHPNSNNLFPKLISTRLIQMYSFVGDTILDPFCGTGTTLLSTMATGRNGIGIENNKSLFEKAREQCKIFNSSLIWTNNLKIFRPKNLKIRSKTISCQHSIYFSDARSLLKIVSPKSVNLVVTSPPYWNIKNYGISKHQIGYANSLTRYFKNLEIIFKACVDVLKPGGHLCINVGNQFVSTDKKKNIQYHTIPIYEKLVTSLSHNPNLLYIWTINWEKVSTSNTSGGGKVMGSFLYPRSPRGFQNREYIIVFQKKGQTKTRISKIYKRASIRTKDEERKFIKDTWQFPGITQDIHPAMFPDELPRRLIKMYSFVNDIVLDPFLGSGTTCRVASQLGRNSIGFELGFNAKTNWKQIIKKKIEFPNSSLLFDYDKTRKERMQLQIHNSYSYYKQNL